MSETDRITRVCNDWESKISSEIPEDMQVRFYNPVFYAIFLFPLFPMSGHSPVNRLRVHLDDMEPDFVLEAK